MKYAIVIPDGMADHPCEELKGKTPLEAAFTPNMDALALKGRVGLVSTIPKGMYPGSDIAMLSILGYDPRMYYPGRAGLEAESMGVMLDDDDIAFRCNLITADEERLLDYSAGHIGTKEAGVLLAVLNAELGSDEVRFHVGVSYRHLMVWKRRRDMRISTVPPHDIIGGKLKDHLPKGEDADDLIRIMLASRELLEGHDINAVRVDLGENPASMIWLWGEGKRAALPGFQERFGIRGAVISGVSLVKSLGKLIGWEMIDVPGATGYLDTDYAAKGRYACDALERFDIVLVHVEAPDEASHEASLAEKVRAIEEIDKEVLGPIVEAIGKFDEHRILVMPDHYTPVEKKTHSSEAVPFLVSGHDVSVIRQVDFTEKAAEETDLVVERGHELMEYFLRGQR